MSFEPEDVPTREEEDAMSESDYSLDGSERYDVADGKETTSRSVQAASAAPSARLAVKVVYDMTVLRVAAEDKERFDQMKHSLHHAFNEHVSQHELFAILAGFAAENFSEIVRRYDNRARAGMVDRATRAAVAAANDPSARIAAAAAAFARLRGNHEARTDGSPRTDP